MTFSPGTPKPPTSGRKVGTPNRETAFVQDIVDGLGMHPAEVLARAANGDAVGLGLVAADDPPMASIEALPISLRIKAASELCSYLLPKRKAVEIVDREEGQRSGVILVPAPVDMDEWTAIVKANKMKTIDHQAE